MSQPSTAPESSSSNDSAPNTLPELGEPTAAANEPTPNERPPSYVKLAMRNMVRKGGTSLYHFALSAIGLFALLIGLAYLTR